MALYRIRPQPALGFLRSDNYYCSKKNINTKATKHFEFYTSEVKTEIPYNRMHYLVPTPMTRNSAALTSLGSRHLIIGYISKN